jgi:hypothetical protein
MSKKKKGGYIGKSGQILFSFNCYEIWGYQNSYPYGLLKIVLKKRLERSPFVRRNVTRTACYLYAIFPQNQTLPVDLLQQKAYIRGMGMGYVHKKFGKKFSTPWCAFGAL